MVIQCEDIGLDRSPGSELVVLISLVKSLSFFPDSLANYPRLSTQLTQ